MFNCNDLSLLNFIKVIRLKEKKKKIDTKFIVKQLKTVFYTIVFFFLAYALNMAITSPNNKCNMYAKKDIIKEYKSSLKEVNDSDMTENSKVEYMEKVLITAYENYEKDDLNNKVKEKTTNNEKAKVVQINNKSDFLKENSDKTLNTVYVKNGVFYYQGYVSGNYNTYYGTHCPSNPLKEGYNNPYGYNNYFYNRLTKFIEDAGKNGYKITMSEQGCRSYQTQVYYYKTMTPGRAAPPGWSFHGLGIASDLEFYGGNGYPCPYGRTDNSCPSMGWAHKNAYKYGLVFPLLNASYKEDWHVEPVNKQSY